MATADVHAQGAPPTARARVRWRFPASLLAVVVVGLAFVWLTPEDWLGRDMQSGITFFSICGSLALLTAWFFFFSGLSVRARLAALAIPVLILVAALVSVRRVEFTGNMFPSFDYRWTPDRTDVLESHRAARATRSTEVSTEPIVIGPRDVPDYRGFKRDGIVPGPALLNEWQARQPKVVWRQPVGGGYAAFVIVGPLLVTIEQRRDKEAVVAYEAATGVERWVYDYPALFSEPLGGDGPRATPTIRDGRVFALGATGVLSCLDLADGKLVWSKNILEVNQAGNLAWGMSGSPLVYDGLILVNPGTQKGQDASRAILAFDAHTGELLFRGGKAMASYASPMLANLGGTRQVLIFDAEGLAGYDVATGQELWRTPWKSDHDVNAAQPIVLEHDRILISSANGCALLHVHETDREWKADTKWKTRSLCSHYANPIQHKDYAYGLDGGIMACVDLKTGKRVWKGGRYGHGQMLLSGDMLVVLSEKGELVLVEATPEAHRELGLIQAIDGKTWNNPALRNGRIFVRNHLEMAAYDLPLLESTAP